MLRMLLERTAEGLAILDAVLVEALLTVFIRMQEDIFEEFKWMKSERSFEQSVRDHRRSFARSNHQGNVLKRVQIQSAGRRGVVSSDGMSLERDRDCYEPCNNLINEPK